MKVHTSNFRILGFVEEAPLPEIVALGREAGVPVLMDEGSGNLAVDEEGPLVGEPSVPGALAAGASLVCFSGDKLLGGPQRARRRRAASSSAARKPSRAGAPARR